MRKHTFSKGLHPPGRKSITRDCAINEMPAPGRVYISLSQHIGKPAIPVVNVGDTVKAGQIIATADGMVSANVYSSVSGTVVGTEMRPTSAGQRSLHIVIENDGQNQSVKLDKIDTSDRNKLLDRIAVAGIVGMGGAGFPTAVKLNPNAPVDVLLINGAECEPYITCDYRLMLEKTAETVEGCRLLKVALGVEKVVIAVEDNKPDAIKALLDYVNKSGISDVTICPVVTKYPQGGEKQLIYSVLGRKVKSGALPVSVGVVVDNVHTAYSTYKAVVDGEPLNYRAVTVTGRGITTPANLWVPIGTLINDVIDYCGGLKGGERVVKMISGGPMMGSALSGGECAITKTSGCVLLMTDKEVSNQSPSDCINCAKCASVCPMNLMPMFIDRYAQLKDVEGVTKYGAMSCMECGCCAYVCPAKRTLVQSMKLAKKLIKEAKK